MAVMKSDPGTFARRFPRRAEENGNARDNKRQPDGGNILTRRSASGRRGEQLSFL